MNSSFSFPIITELVTRQVLVSGDSRRTRARMAQMRQCALGIK